MYIRNSFLFFNSYLPDFQIWSDAVCAMYLSLLLILNNKWHTCFTMYNFLSKQWFMISTSAHSKKKVCTSSHYWNIKRRQYLFLAHCKISITVTHIVSTLKHISLHYCCDFQCWTLSCTGLLICKYISKYKEYFIIAFIKMVYSAVIFTLHIFKLCLLCPCATHFVNKEKLENYQVMYE